MHSETRVACFLRRFKSLSPLVEEANALAGSGVRGRGDPLRRGGGRGPSCSVWLAHMARCTPKGSRGHREGRGEISFDRPPLRHCRGSSGAHAPRSQSAQDAPPGEPAFATQHAWFCREAAASTRECVFVASLERYCEGRSACLMPLEAPSSQITSSSGLQGEASEQVANRIGCRDRSMIVEWCGRAAHLLHTRA